MAGPLSRLKLAQGSGLSLSSQLRAQISLLIADGALRPGDALPAVRPLAKELGVSVNTIRAAYTWLEADGLVHTRQGVGTIVLEAPARGLAAGPAPLGSNAIGVLIAGLDPFYLPLLRGIEEVADDHGMLVLVADTQDSSERATAVIRRLVARGVDGLIVVSVGELDRPSGDRGPFPPAVYVDQPAADGYGVVFNAEHGGYLATAHLLDHGHERVGLVTVPVGWPNVAPLAEGYRRAHAERGLASSPDLMVEVSGFTVDAGREGLARLRELADPPGAVFAIGAVLAFGVLDGARRAGVRVPGDLAVAGYTDVGLAALVEPPLTMVSVPAHESGRRAATTLVRLIRGERVRSRVEVLDVDLVVRSSCGDHGPR